MAIELIHPVHGVVAIRAEGCLSLNKIIDKWKMLYGKKYKECLVYVNGDICIDGVILKKDERRILYKITKEVFKNIEEASVNLKMSPDDIMWECRKLNSREFKFIPKEKVNED